MFHQSGMQAFNRELALSSGAVDRSRRVIGLLGGYRFNTLQGLGVFLQVVGNGADSFEGGA